MPRKKCGFGLNCAAMMLQPGLEAENCPNYKTCGSASQLTSEEEVELLVAREIQRAAREQERQEQREESARVLERIRVSRQQLAVMMLMRRACPQSLEDFGISDRINTIETRLCELRSHLSRAELGYIAPNNCEAHRYYVKRGYANYLYNKLTSTDAIFEPEEKETKVKVIHLSHDDDPRNIEARLGIERRNRLHQVETRLDVVAETLSQAASLLNELRSY